MASTAAQLLLGLDVSPPRFSYLPTCHSLLFHQFSFLLLLKYGVSAKFSSQLSISILLFDDFAHIITSISAFNTSIYGI